MNNFLSIGGGAAIDDTPKASVLLDAMSATTGWTLEAGDGAAWAVWAPGMTTEAHVGPQSGTWFRAFTGFSAYDGTHMGMRLYKTFSTTDVSTMNNIGFWYGYDATWSTESNHVRVYQISVYMGSDGDGSLTNSVKATFTPTTQSLFGGGFLAFDRTDFAANAGTFDWADMQDVRIEILGSNGNAGVEGTLPVRTYMQGLQINHYYKPTVVISHDDGPGGFYDNGKAVSDSFGYKTTQFVYPEAIDAVNPNVFSLAETTELYNEGHDICLHATYSGDVLSTMSAAEIDADLVLGLAWLDDNGFSRGRHCISYPSGTFKDSATAAVYDIYAARGITVARGSFVWYNNDNWQTVDSNDSTETNHCMNLSTRTVDTVNAYSTVLRPALERVCKYGGVLILNFHNVLVSGAATTAINVADYTAALQMIKDYETRGRLQVRTLSQVFDTSGNLTIVGD